MTALDEPTDRRQHHSSADLLGEAYNAGTGELASWIGGRPAAGDGEAAERISPATGIRLFTSSPLASGQLDDAVRRAQTQAGGQGWSAAVGRERGAVLRRAAELLEQRADAFADLLVSEVGKPLREARGEVDAAANNLDYCAGLARSIGGRTPHGVAEGLFALTLREPAGVAGLIVPWNFPLAILCQKLPYALAAGCPTIVKPSPLTPLSAIALARLLHEAGLPEDALHVVLGEGDVGAALVEHPDVDVISFTGSTATGRVIAAAAGSRRLKRVAIEAGGKTPVLVLADAPLESAVDGALFSAYFNQGEVCVAGSRLLVDTRIAEDFAELLAERAGRIRLGDPRDGATEMGPLVSAGHLERVSGLLTAGVAAGARLRTGGAARDIPGPGGPFLAPTLVDEIQPGNPLLRDELFGPVTTLEPVGDLDEAVRRANDSAYGLAASVWTRDLEFALEAVRRLRVGTVWVNGSTDAFPELPLGGRRDSGFGAELGPEGLEFFTDVKTVQISTGGRARFYGG